MSKIKKTLSKNHKLKVRKQKLCDRINQCKSLSEIKGWEKTFAYHDVLKDDFDWDEGFFFDLIEFKLKRMRDYFWSHNIVENEKQYGDICNKLINILNAGYKTNVVADKDLKNYVNIRNANRFLSKYEHSHLNNSEVLYNKYFKATLREAKAKILFWKYLHHRVEWLWD